MVYGCLKKKLWNEDIRKLPNVEHVPSACCLLEEGFDPSTVVEKLFWKKYSPLIIFILFDHWQQPFCGKNAGQHIVWVPCLPSPDSILLETTARKWRLRIYYYSVSMGTCLVLGMANSLQFLYLVSIFGRRTICIILYNTWVWSGVSVISGDIFACNAHVKHIKYMNK